MAEGESSAVVFTNKKHFWLIPRPSSPKCKQLRNICIKGKYNAKGKITVHCKGHLELLLVCASLLWRADYSRHRVKDCQKTFADNANTHGHPAIQNSIHKTSLPPPLRANINSKTRTCYQGLDCKGYYICSLMAWDSIERKTDVFTIVHRSPKGHKNQ